MLCLVIDKGIRNDSGNGHIVEIDKIMMSPIDGKSLFEREVFIMQCPDCATIK